MPGVKWIGASPQNYEAVTIVPKFFVLHIAEGDNQSGIDAWFNDPRAQVSAHLSASKLGVVHEYVQMNQLAYHCGPWNDRSIGMEFLGYWGDDMTFFQRRAFRRAALYAHQTFHIPLRLTFNPNDPAGGFIAHGRIPEGALSHPNCPGDPILIDADRILHQLSTKPVTLLSIIQSWLDYKIT